MINLEERIEISVKKEAGSEGLRVQMEADTATGCLVGVSILVAALAKELNLSRYECMAKLSTIVLSDILEHSGEENEET